MKKQEENMRSADVKYEKAGFDSVVKRNAILFLVFLMCLPLSACGQKAATEAAPTWQEQYDLGVRYLSEGNYEEAILAFTAAIEIDPKKADAYLGMAEVYIAQGNTDAADEVLTNALAVVEDSAIIQARLDELKKQADGKTEPEPEVQPEVVLEPESQPQPEPKPEPESEPESHTGKDYTGDVQRMSFYDGSGALVGYQTFTYDEQGRESSVTSFDAAGNQTGHVDIAYDAEGHQLTYYSYNGDGTLNGRIVCEYDGNGNWIECECYGLDTGKLESYELFYHDGQGNLIRTELYDADGELLFYELYTYGENSERRDSYGADGSSQGYRVWRHRVDGQLADYCDYNSDGTLSWRSVCRYDDTGKRIGEDSYDGEGNLTGSTVSE